jgi:transcriptional regulator with XRE-family HTH domain
MGTHGLGELIGLRVRAARAQRGLTLRELGAQSGLSKALLSTLERGGGNPSIDTLFRLATSLGVSITELLGEDAAEPEVVRAGEGRRMDAEDGSISARLLFASSGHRRFEIYECEMPPHARSEWDLRHAADVTEFITVREGHARVGPVGAEQLLGPGDAIAMRIVRRTAIEAGDAPVRLTSVIAYSN